MDQSRRRFLTTSGSCLGLFALAGCTAVLTGAGSTTPTADPEGGTGTGAGTETGTGTGTTTDGTENPSTTENGRSRQETVTVQTANGAIEATLYGRGDCGVVLVPQIDLDRESWEPQAEAVAGMGHVALAIDENPDARAASVLGAVRYLREEVGVDRVALVGASTGGEAVVTANARADPGDVQGTMTLSAAGGADHASDLQGRLLFVVSEGDESRFVGTARALEADAPDRAELVTYSGSAHGQGLFDSSHARELRGRFSEFVSGVCEGS